jgi:hypothetical protein
MGWETGIESGPKRNYKNLERGRGVSYGVFDVSQCKRHGACDAFCDSRSAGTFVIAYIVGQFRVGWVRSSGERNPEKSPRNSKRFSISLAYPQNPGWLLTEIFRQVWKLDR